MPTPQPNEQPEPVNTFVEMLNQQISHGRTYERDYDRKASYYKGRADMAEGILCEWEEKYALASDPDSTRHSGLTDTAQFLMATV